MLAVIFSFRTSIWNGLSKTGEFIFGPVLSFGQTSEYKFSDLYAYFVSKKSLYWQNQDFLEKLKAEDARMANYDSVVSENASLKEILNRKDPQSVLILSDILAKPNQSLYDTLLIDTGTKDGVKTGDTVFAFGNIPIGHVSDVYPDTSKVILFTNPGETTEVVISPKINPATVSATTDVTQTTATASTVPESKNAYVELIGRGGGNFEIDMPKDMVLNPGDQVILPGVKSYVIAIVEKIISDPRNPFNKALLESPVNITGLRFVEVGE